MCRLTILTLAVLVFAPLADAQEGSLALAVKAAYLIKMEPFITWPAAWVADTQSPFDLCVAGRDPFGSLLDRAAAGQRVAGHAVTVRRFSDAADAKICQILYIPPSDPQTVRRALDAVRGRAVLTVTDGVEPGEQRGMINFLLIDDRVRFTIDDDAAEGSGLDISSKLLSLAISVRHKGP